MVAERGCSNFRHQWINNLPMEAATSKLPVMDANFEKVK